MLCKCHCHWIVLYTVHFIAFCLGWPFFPGHGVVILQTRELQVKVVGCVCLHGRTELVHVIQWTTSSVTRQHSDLMQILPRVTREQS